MRPRAKRTLYEIQVQVDAMLDLTDLALLQEFGVDHDNLVSALCRPCENLGGAVAWLERDGLLVPSVRAEGVNLVIFVNAQGPDAAFDVLSAEVIGAE